MIKDERVSKIVNEVLEKERDKTVEAFLKVEKINREITGRCIEMDYRSMILLYPTILLEYVDNIEKSITYNEKQGNVIKKAQSQLERWISIYESSNVVEESYEYLRQEKAKLEDNFKEKMKNSGQEESILRASAKIGGVALRNLQRENNNLDGEIEKYPYTKEQLEMIDEYNTIIKKQEILEEYAEQNYTEENEENEDDEEEEDM